MAKRGPKLTSIKIGNTQWLIVLDVNVAAN